MSLRAAATILISATLAACVTPRFVDRPIVWRVDDTRDVPTKPEPRDYFAMPYMANTFLLRRSTRALELRDHEPASSTNALDEAPDSTWFQNRLGRRALSVAEVARGPIRGPELVLPLQITSGKTGGGNPGFMAKDGAGRTFVVKFDPKHNPELQTSADIIVGRLLWAAGYNVPEDRILVLCEPDLQIAPNATAKNVLGDKIPFSKDVLASILAEVARRPDGCWRAITSEFLKGAPIGGTPNEGVRKDDPNDTIPHELRRELRGLRVFAAWLNHTDMKEDNTLDMWVEEDGRHFVRHYLIDFGEALGGHVAEKDRFEDGYENFWDWQKQPLALLALGFWVRPWEHLTNTRWPAIGAFTHEYFDPRDWREAYPYWPFIDSDDTDAYWAAKIIVRYTPEMIEAVVREGQLSDPEATEYMANALYQRARIIGRTYLESQSPLDHFEVKGNRLHMIDLGIHHDFAVQGLVQRIDDRGFVLAEATSDKDGRVSLGIPTEGYEVLRLRVVRGDDERPPIELHFSRGKLVGVIRN